MDRSHLAPDQTWRACGWITGPYAGPTMDDLYEVTAALIERGESVLQGAITTRTPARWATVIESGPADDLVAGSSSIRRDLLPICGFDTTVRAGRLSLCKRPKGEQHLANDGVLSAVR